MSPKDLAARGFGESSRAYDVALSYAHKPENKKLKVWLAHLRAATAALQELEGRACGVEPPKGGE